MKKILITGASGFIGKKIARLFLLKGYSVIGMGTSPKHPFSGQFQGFDWISADTTIKGKWQDKVAESDIIINLAGRNIFRYWTKKYKQAIYNSRILTTRHIVNAMEKGKAQTLLTTSAIGIYGDCKDEVLTEKRSAANDFLADVCVNWEAEGLKAQEKGARVVVMRFGVVLGDKGALALMTPAFKMFAGGPLGDGQQWFPWIHVRDLEKAIEFIIENKETKGVFNFTGPTPVRQKQFAKALGHALNRPAFMPAPSFMVKAIMGELGRSLLQSQRAIPKNLLDSGYSFSFPTVTSAFEDIFRK
ncbi:TIGR01777 family oxidoreductase [Desulfobacula sp.]